MTSTPVDREAWIAAGDVCRPHADVDARARSAAAGLAAYGIGPGDAVALLLHNDLVVFETQRAAVLIGAAAVALDREMAAEDLLFILADCAARVLVGHTDLLAPLRGRLPASLPVIVVPTPRFVHGNDAVEGDDAPLWDAWLAPLPSFDGEPERAPPQLTYTSGSTGRPKGVRRPGSTKPGGSAKAKRVYGFDKPGRAVALVTGPLSHSVPWAFARLAMAAGADIVLMARFDPREALALIARHGVTHVHLSPNMMLRLLRQPADVAARCSTGSLRHVVHGAAPCPPWLALEAIAAWGPIVHQYYGSTETGLLTMADSADAMTRPGNVGRALEGVTLALFDDAGEAVQPGEAGMVYARSATLHRFEYLGRASDRAAVGRGDLVTAGDIGHLDADGYLYLHDRGRDLIRTAEGATVVPAEIEVAILAVPGVADCAVLGLPGDGGAIVCACVELLPDTSLSEEELRAALYRRSSRQPDRVAILAALPRADTGKVFKHKLKRQLEQSR